MRNYSIFLGDVTFPVVEFRRGKKYVNGIETDIIQSRYTIVDNYEKIDIVVEDAGNVVTQQQLKEFADAGTPIEMIFKEAEIIIKPKTKYEIQASGTARHASVVNSEKSK